MLLLLHRRLGPGPLTSIGFYVVTIFQSPTVAEYAKFLKRDYGPAVDRWLGTTDHVAEASTDGPGKAEPANRVDEATIRRMRDLIPCLPPLENNAQRDGDRNRRDRDRDRD